jgi:hypothetical protein
MAAADELAPILHYRPLPYQPDPAALLQFFVELEQPAAARQQAFVAFLQYSHDTALAQVKFVQALQKAAAAPSG